MTVGDRCCGGWQWVTDGSGEWQWVTDVRWVAVGDRCCGGWQWVTVVGSG